MNYQDLSPLGQFLVRHPSFILPVTWLLAVPYEVLVEIHYALPRIVDDARQLTRDLRTMEPR